MPLYPPVGGSSSPTTLLGPLGFFGASPTGQPNGYVSSMSGTTKTMPAYTANAQSSAYVGGLLDLLQAGRLGDLNALRVSAENTRVLSENTAKLLNQLLADLKNLGLIA